ncbi:hypothetical protein [Streptomyces olivochromogenes]|uniref:hypothetical protein n=1 Tax=Streptomyces olivochromogenes TaxID=1963 RepID=UPI001914BA1D
MGELLEADVADELDLVGGFQQLVVVELGEVVAGFEVLTAGGVGLGEVEEVVDVKGGDVVPQPVDRLVPEVVQRGVEQPDRARHDHLGDVGRARPLLGGELLDNVGSVLEEGLALLGRDDDVVRGQPPGFQHLEHQVFECLQIRAGGLDLNRSLRCGNGQVVWDVLRTHVFLLR